MNGAWGGVCSDKWTDTESYVACGNLGYPDIEVSEITITSVIVVFDFDFQSFDNQHFY